MGPCQPGRKGCRAQAAPPEALATARSLAPALAPGAAAIADRRSGIFGCLPGVVARPGERRGDHVRDAKGAARLCEQGEVLRRPPARHWKVAGRRAQVLADRDNLHSDRLQVGKHTDDFCLGLA